MSKVSFKTYGHVFSVSDKYAEGHVLTAVEAAALNRLRAENISHHIRGKSLADVTKDVPLTPEQIAAAEAEVAELDQTYEFSMGTGSGTRTVDPVEREAMAIARVEVTKAVKREGKKVGKKENPEGYVPSPDEYPYEKFAKLVAQVAARDGTIAKAKKIVAQKAKEADVGEITL